jgi:hypothetical protein
LEESFLVGANLKHSNEWFIHDPGLWEETEI